MPIMDFGGSLVGILLWYRWETLIRFLDVVNEYYTPTMDWHMKMHITLVAVDGNFSLTLIEFYFDWIRVVVNEYMLTIGWPNLCPWYHVYFPLLISP
jgi:hypothetical protein